ncbi:protein NATD1-like [Uranotaenia lowii]|uniref:protein NATD1-like n=1 Tax=Uranotaenia lowii TaxID=190385 RepID=UPI0024792BBA|nr:protein NATD1-like [Uranotaenia lowii]
MIPSRILAANCARPFTRLARAQFSSEGLPIQHNEAEFEFQAKLQGQKAFLSYRLDKGKRRISFDHTEVPAVFQGKGVGRKLVQKAFQYAVEKDLKIQIHCDFAYKYYKDNEDQFKDRVIE